MGSLVPCISKYVYIISPLARRRSINLDKPRISMAVGAEDEKPPIDISRVPSISTKAHTRFWSPILVMNSHPSIYFPHLSMEFPPRWSRRPDGDDDSPTSAAGLLEVGCLPKFRYSLSCHCHPCPGLIAI